MSTAGHARYEQRDVRARPLLLFALGLVLLTAVSLWLVGWLVQRSSAALEATRRVSPLGEFRGPPPGPALEVVPAAELEALRAREQELLMTTAWIDPLNGVVRIPIERALELVAREGLPARESGR
jgi:HAMP domain-containing protein